MIITSFAKKGAANRSFFLMQLISYCYDLDVDVMGIYRSQLSAGADDYDPDDWSESGTAARTVDTSTGMTTQILI